VFSPNPDATEGPKHNSAIVPYFEYYYPKYSCDPIFNWDNKYMSNRIKRYQGIWVEIMASARNLYRRLVKNHFTPPTQVTGNCQPNREQRNVSEYAGTRRIISTAKLLCWMLDDIFLRCYSLRILIVHCIISSSCTQRTFLILGEYCVSVYVF
jgi:hypothetical protein